MLQKISLKFLILALVAMTAISCSKDDDDDDNDSNNNPGDTNVPSGVSDPSELEEGSAEFTGAGAETFVFTNATCSWRYSGSVTSNDTLTYAINRITLENAEADVRLEIDILVKDSTAGAFFGEFFTVGSYELGLSPGEQDSGEYDAYAEVEVSGSGVEYYYTDESDSEGSVEITNITGDEIEGYTVEGFVNASGLTDIFDAPDGTSLNIAASFKAPEF